MSVDRRRSLPRLLLVALLLGAPGSVHAQTAPVQYAYDELGRLIAVVDPQGNAAVYVWDAVGNLLRIDRVDAASLSGAVGITAMVPAKGKVGTTVRLFGKGFSPTAAQNSVSFNGASATVTAATANSLTTTVPAGAMTGPISVTAPLGSAASATAFQVVQPLTLSPASVNLSPGATQAFTALAGGSATTAVTWRVNGVLGGAATVGTITTAGVYTAPATAPTPPTVLVMATSTDDPSLSASALVGFLPAQSIMVVGGIGAAPWGGGPATAGAGGAVSVRIGDPAPVVNRTLWPAVSVAVAPPAPTVNRNIPAAVSVALQPVITAVAPASAAAGTTGLAVTLTGAGFTGATAVTAYLANAVDSAFTITNLAVTSDTQATLALSVASGTATGARILRITTPGGTSTAAGTGGNLFTVQ